MIRLWDRKIILWVHKQYEYICHEYIYKSGQDRICLNRKGQDWALRNLISDKPKPALLSLFTYARSHFTVEIASIWVHFILCLQLELSNFLIYWVLRPWDIAVQGCCTFGKDLSPCAVCPGIQHHPRTPNCPIFLHLFFKKWVNRLWSYLATDLWSCWSYMLGWQMDGASCKILRQRKG